MQEKHKKASGSKPFFLKESDKKKLALVAKCVQCQCMPKAAACSLCTIACRYDQLKSKGKLDKFMEQRRKRNASKDRKQMPSHE